jgi:hypothetical protein
MLPYQDYTSKLEKLLERLFEDSESTSEDVEVLRKPRPFESSSSCCTYNYGGY